MYAIIRAGGKQTKVHEGDVINVERLRHIGEEVTFTPILVVDDSGTAISERDELSAITVRARVLGEVRGEKVDVFKFKSKTGYRRSQGHRQTYTTLEVTGIEMPGAKKQPETSARTKPEAVESADEAVESADEAVESADEAVESVDEAVESAEAVEVTGEAGKSTGPASEPATKPAAKPAQEAAPKADEKPAPKRPKAAKVTDEPPSKSE